MEPKTLLRLFASIRGLDFLFADFADAPRLFLPVPALRGFGLCKSGRTGQSSLPVLFWANFFELVAQFGGGLVIFLIDCRAQFVLEFLALGHRLFLCGLFLNIIEPFAK